MDRLPLNALRAFALVLERGGVRAAARELAISHSAVSRHLKELERWLGVALLEKRDGGGWRATAQGQLLAEAARNGLHGMQQAVEAVREQRSSYSVSVCATPSFAVRWLLPRLPALQRSYPRLEVSVVVDQRLEEPGSFSSDLAIRTGRGPWPALLAEPLMDECLYPLVRPFETRVIDLGAAYWIVRPRGGAPREAVTILLAWLRREAERTPLVPS